jgi:outer membrane protein assembly factor BamB
MANNSFLFIGIKGTVLALDRATGAEVWVAALKGSDFVNLALEGGDLYATTKGEIFCLDPATGAVRWSNPLRGYGWGLISIASAGGGQTILMREKQRRDEEAAAAASTTATHG